MAPWPCGGVLLGGGSGVGVCPGMDGGGSMIVGSMAGWPLAGVAMSGMREPQLAQKRSLATTCAPQLGQFRVVVIAFPLDLTRSRRAAPGGAASKNSHGEPAHGGVLLG